MAMELDHEADLDEAPERIWQSREVQWSAASGLLLALGFLVEQLAGNETAATALWVAATFAGVRFFALEAFEELRSEREVGIELLMTIAAVTAGALGLWEEAAMLAFLYSISEALEEFTEDRTRGAIRAHGSGPEAGAAPRRPGNGNRDRSRGA